MALRVVYTCITGGYDRVFPPLSRTPDTDYVIFTDEPDLQIPGWDIRPIDMSKGETPSQLNRYYKFFCQKVLPEHRYSLYIDGNIRPIGNLGPLFAIVETEGSEIALQAHPQNRNISDEVESCITSGRVRSADAIRAEYHALVQAGFEEQGNMTENNIILRDHEAPALNKAMRMWWDFLINGSGRDQISLPFVLQKTGLRLALLDFQVRAPNPYFQFFPHFGEMRRWQGRIRTYCIARSPESVIFRLGVKLLSKKRRD